MWLVVFPRVQTAMLNGGRICTTLLWGLFSDLTGRKVHRTFPPLHPSTYRSHSEPLRALGVPAFADLGSRVHRRGLCLPRLHRQLPVGVRGPGRVRSALQRPNARQGQHGRAL